MTSFKITAILSLWFQFVVLVEKQWFWYFGLAENIKTNCSGLLLHWQATDKSCHFTFHVPRLVAPVAAPLLRTPRTERQTPVGSVDPVYFNFLRKHMRAYRLGACVRRDLVSCWWKYYIVRIKATLSRIYM